MTRQIGVDSKTQQSGGVQEIKYTRNCMTLGGNYIIVF